MALLSASLLYVGVLVLQMRISPQHFTFYVACWFEGECPPHRLTCLNTVPDLWRCLGGALGGGALLDQVHSSGSGSRRLSVFIIEDIISQISAYHMDSTPETIKPGKLFLPSADFWHSVLSQG